MNENLTNDIEFARAFADLYKTGIEMSKLDIESISIMIRFNEQNIRYHYEKEPMKIFKKLHKEWEEELEKLHNKLNELYKSYEVALDDYYSLVNN